MSSDTNSFSLKQVIDDNMVDMVSKFTPPQGPIGYHTPFSYACYRGRYEICIELLKHGYTPYIYGSKVAHPMIEAIRSGNPRLIEWLIISGVYNFTKPTGSESYTLFKTVLFYTQDLYWCQKIVDFYPQLLTSPVDKADYLQIAVDVESIELINHCLKVWDCDPDQPGSSKHSVYYFCRSDRRYSYYCPLLKPDGGKDVAL